MLALNSVELARSARSPAPRSYLVSSLKARRHLFLGNPGGHHNMHNGSRARADDDPSTVEVVGTHCSKRA